MNSASVACLFSVASAEMRRAFVGQVWGDIRSSAFDTWSLSCFSEIQTEMFNKQLGKPFRSLQEVQPGCINVVAIGEQVLFSAVKLMKSLSG